LLHMYRVRGHLAATLDPLQLQIPLVPSDLNPRHHGLTEEDLDRSIFLGPEKTTLRKSLDIFKKVYCGTIGAEFMYLSDPEQRLWIQEKMENRLNETLSPENKKRIFARLLEAETFETFLGIKFVGAKRFGLEGSESFVVALGEAL